MEQFIVATTADELARGLELRREVFIEEQGVPEAHEVDGLDPDCIQFLAIVDHETVGTARLRQKAPSVFKVERVCVRRPFRASGVGARLMAYVESVAEARHADTLVLAAQVDVIRFYERLGYVRQGQMFEEAGIDHVMMDKKLSPSERLT